MLKFYDFRVKAASKEVLEADAEAGSDAKGVFNADAEAGGYSTGGLEADNGR